MNLRIDIVPFAGALVRALVQAALVQAALVQAALVQAAVVTGVAALLALASCGSPLDVPTQRIDSALTNRIKLRSIAVSARIDRPTYSVALDDWRYTVRSLTFEADTTSSPPRITMNCLLDVSPQASEPEAFLRRVHVRLDNVDARGTLSLVGDPRVGTGAGATVIVNGVEYNPGRNYTASGAFFYTEAGPKQIQGTVAIGIDCGADFWTVVAVNFLANQD